MCDGEVVELTANSNIAVSYSWSNGGQTAVIEVTETGTYVVTVYDENGCEAMDSIAIEVLPNPEVEIGIAGGNPFCDGDSIMLTANCATATGYAWSNGSDGTSIWVTEAGTYSVEVVDSNECTASTSVEVEVYELPKVEIEITSGSNPFCEGDSIQLTAVSPGAVSYEWSNGSTDASIWVYEAGVYMVAVVDEVGCANSTEIEVETDPLPEVEIMITSGSNPACDNDSIQLTAISQTAQVFLWSTGQTTESIWVYESGNYCVTVGSGDGCVADACMEIEFNANPEIEVEVTAGSNPLCDGDEVELTAVSATAVGYEWSTNESSSSIVVTSAGTYTVDVVDDNGCSATASIEIEEGLIPLIEIEGETEFCVNDSVMLTA